MTAFVPGVERVTSPAAAREPRVRARHRVRHGLSAWWHAAELDRQLAIGADPSTSDALAIRAHRITRPRSRRRVAGGLSGALRGAKDRTPGFTAAVRPDARELLAAGPVVAALHGRLRTAEPVSARGVAILLGLLTDGTSPLYQPAEPGVLASHLRAAAAALEPDRRWD